MWQNLNSKKQQDQIDWRRAKVLEMMSKGETNQSEIAKTLQVDKSVISKDVAVIRERSRENLERHIQERLPLEYQNCMTGIDPVIEWLATLQKN
jgi:transcriptional regulator